MRWLRVTVADAGVTARVKSGAGAGFEITRVTCVVWTVLPLVPVIVSG